MYRKVHKLNLFYNLQFNYSDVHVWMDVMATAFSENPNRETVLLTPPKPPLMPPPRLNSRPKSTHDGFNSCP